MAGKAGWLERSSSLVTTWAGSSWAFALAFAIILVWGITGPIFHYSDTWQLVINTGTTIVTFLMVFLIQRSQNKESIAIQLKLNELVAAVGGASNRLISAEDMTEDEVKVLRDHFRKLVEVARQEKDITCQHTIEEAEEAEEAGKELTQAAEKAKEAGKQLEQAAGNAASQRKSDRARAASVNGSKKPAGGQAKT
jgi:low affinity Fe/Cu permease